jgi:hypothetical protein
MRTSSPSPLRVSSRDSCGLLPERFRSHHKTKRSSGFNPQLRRFPTCIGRDAAPVWCHPRQREEAGKGHSSLDRGRHPTDASQVVPNPRIAAGSTVGFTGPVSFHVQRSRTIMKPSKKLSPTVDIGSHINAMAQPRPSVASKPSDVGCSHWF